MKKHLKKFGSIYVLTFINGLSMSLLMPVLPFVIKIYDQPEIVLWILISTFAFFQMFWASIMWSLSDKFWRKPILLITQFWTFLSWIVFWSAYFLPDVYFWAISIPIFVMFLARILDWITGWNVSVANAYIWDLSTKEERTSIFGYNAAVNWFAVIVWSSLWSIAMTFYSFLWTAILWALFWFFALLFMFFRLKESLKEENRKKEFKFSLSEFNIAEKIFKLSKNSNIRMLFSFNFFIFFAFSAHFTIFTLYLIDIFWLSELEVGYYLFFTWSFLIINQMFFVKKIVKKIWDFMSLKLWFLLIISAFFLMWNVKHLPLFIIIYFFANLWVSLCMTTNQALLSKSVDEKSQWEIMWANTSLMSFIFIISPLMSSYLYSFTFDKYYVVISLFLLTSFVFLNILFKKVKIN